VKKIGFKLILLTILLSMLVAFKFIGAKEIDILPTVSKGLDNYPIMSNYKNGILYNVMYPYKSKISSLTGDSYTNYSADEIVEIYIMNYIEFSNISYQIINPIDGHIIKSSTISKSNISIKDEYIVAKILIPTMEKSEFPYILNITYNKKGGTTFNYYQHFYYDNNDIIDDINKITNDFHKATFNKDTNTINKLIKGSGTNKQDTFSQVNNLSSMNNIIWNFNKDIIKMNEPIIKITNINNMDNRYEVEMTYTIAVRHNHEFDYWDFTERYIFRGNNQASIDSFERVGTTKRDVFYNEENNFINMGSGSEKFILEQKQSNNKRFLSFVRNKQLWLFDKTNNRVLKIFGFDKLDSDYIVDNYNAHNIKIINLDNDGNITYSVYGYMNIQDNQGSNGVSLYQFNYINKENKNIGFIHLPYEFSELDYYLSDYMYVPESNQYMYLMLKGSLYKFDFINGDYTNIINSLPIDKKKIYISKDKKAMFWDTKKNKNKDVNGVIISENKINKLEIRDEKYNSTIIGSLKDYFIIAYYDLKQTIEELDGDVTYLYSKIQVLNSEGKVIKEYIPKKGNYYKNINLYEQGIKVSSVKVEKYLNSNARYSKVNIKLLKEEEFVINTLEEDNLYKIDRVKLPYGYDTVILNNKENNNIKNSNLNINDNDISTYNIKRINKTNKDIEFKDNNYREIYKVISKGKIIGLYDSISDALEYPNSIDFVIKALSNNKNKIVYKNKKIDYAMIKGIPVIPQKPELIRGCEVTSLTMLLNYYLPYRLDKLQLANEIGKDETPYKIIDGMINFGNAHEGFVGDMEKATNKGYGVYNEPIAKLAENYLPGNILNISGCNFEHVLYYVGIGKPVWVISPNIYKKVPKSSIQQWNTPSGIIEATYTEHSVLVVGFDDKYIYFNDPSKNKLTKKLISDFKAGWESIGRQAILIYE
jgi:uncharacterized protein YvpB